jgi:hypothetical protein
VPKQVCGRLRRANQKRKAKKGPYLDTRWTKWSNGYSGWYPALENKLW